VKELRENMTATVKNMNGVHRPWKLLVGAVGAIALAFASIAIGQVNSAGNMRALIAPNAAIDGLTYDEYQRCLAKIPLSQDSKRVIDARQGCKDKALKAAYGVPTRDRTTDEKTGLHPVPSVKERTELQRTELERIKK
jgi:hypothetical protein